MPSFTRIADNTGPFISFGPYVPAISEAGVVAFTAALRAGGTAVFTAPPRGALTAAARSGEGPGEILSHPDLNDRGDLCFYARGPDGGARVWVQRGGALAELGADAGPLGPTMSPRGAVAFRAGEAPSAVFLHDGALRRIADDTRSIAGFEGLPVVTDEGLVVLRAALRSGGHLIAAGRGGALTPIADTGDDLAELGRFPSANAAGDVAFAALSRDGRSGAFVARDGEVRRVAHPPFASVRGALIDGRGRLVLLATPAGGALGVYRDEERLFGLGDTRFGAPIADFALNPVSINEAGQLAARLRLEDGAELIVQVEAP